jgi:methyl-accepting chemotaxis protein
MASPDPQIVLDARLCRYLGLACAATLLAVCGIVYALSASLGAAAVATPLRDAVGVAGSLILAAAAVFGTTWLARSRFQSRVIATCSDRPQAGLCDMTAGQSDNAAGQGREATQFVALRAHGQDLAQACGSVDEAHACLRSILAASVAFTEETAFGILRRLHELDAAVQSLVRHLTPSGQPSDTIVQNAHERSTANHLLFSNLEQYACGRREEVAASRLHLLEIVASIESLAPMLGSIDAMASQTNLLALNVSIAPAPTDEAGFANAVQDLSRQSMDATAQIRTELARTQEMVGSFLSERFDASHTGHGRDTLESFSRQLAEAVQGYDELAAYLRQVIEAADEQSRVVADMITGAIGDIQFQDILRQQLEFVGEGLSILGTCTGQVGSSVAALPEVHGIEGASEPVRRMMDHHVPSTGPASRTGSEPLVELFD